ncbi:hypothetical protein EB118_04865 [bacterium]|nr:hypothetical protein [bacterium]NDC94169.1 hypothetical protein [bacterium]NDD82767.1 hypothetical protein [bacterium]NDG29418.1 hypothetical protein [bacterium]
MSKPNVDGITLYATDLVIKENKVYIGSQITQNAPGVLFIWAKWCGHCTKFIPTFNSIDKKIGHKFIMLHIEESELKKRPEVARALNVQGFPTIKFFDQYNEVQADYVGSRDEASLLNSICKIYHYCYSQ